MHSNPRVPKLALPAIKNQLAYFQVPTSRAIRQNFQEEINNLIRPISIKKAESMINNLPKQKAPLVDSIKKFKKEVIPIISEDRIRGNTS